jgi:AraC-like DNA-binding protein
MMELTNLSDPYNAAFLGGKVVCHDLGTTVKRMHYEAGTQISTKTIDQCCLLCTRKGKIKIGLDSNTCFISSGEFCVLTTGMEIDCMVMDSSDLMFISIPTNQNIIQSSIYLKSEELKRIMSEPFSMKAMKMSEPMTSLTDFAYDMLKNGINTPDFRWFFINGLLLLLRKTYPIESLVEIFKPMLKSDLSFKNETLEKLNRGYDVSKIIRESGMCKSKFYNKFNQEFGTSIHKWTQDRKAERMMSMILDLSMNLKDISINLSFISLSDMNRFCHKYFHKSPTELRAELINKK